MKIINIHQRIIRQPLEEIGQLLSTLSTKEDKIMPIKNWPRMRLDNHLNIGSKGGHGPIRYEVVDYQENKNVKFKFKEPKGFDGFHEFSIQSVDNHHTKISHTINMKTSLFGTIQWYLAIKWLHDALLEDGMDGIENYFLPMSQHKKTKWNPWVIILRKLF